MKYAEGHTDNPSHVHTDGRNDYPSQAPTHAPHKLHQIQLISSTTDSSISSPTINLHIQQKLQHI